MIIVVRFLRTARKANNNARTGHVQNQKKNSFQNFYEPKQMLKFHVECKPERHEAYCPQHSLSGEGILSSGEKVPLPLAATLILGGIHNVSKGYPLDTG